MKQAMIANYSVHLDSIFISGHCYLTAESMKMRFHIGYIASMVSLYL